MRSRKVDTGLIFTPKRRDVSEAQMCQKLRSEKRVDTLARILATTSASYIYSQMINTKYIYSQMIITKYIYSQMINTKYIYS